MASHDGKLLKFIEVAGVWSLTPYRGCPHACGYCIARAQGEAVPGVERDQLIATLCDELRHVPDGTEIFVGAMADAYPPVERDLGLTRLVLLELVAQRRPFCIATKSELVCRDLDVLAAYDGHCDVGMSLCTTDEAALAQLEPGAPSGARRLAALARLHDAGVETFLDLAPWIPGLSDVEMLIASVPAGTMIQIGPLDLHQGGGVLHLLGRTYTQRAVLEAYETERQRFGEAPGVIWKDPMTW